MTKIKFYTWAACLIIIYAPFFVLGLTIGQFIGAIYFGYKEGHKWITDNSKNLLRAARTKNQEDN